jgi:hypothetical protein
MLLILFEPASEIAKIVTKKFAAGPGKASILWFETGGSDSRPDI